MAGAPVVQCIGPSYHLDDRRAAVQSAVNCYPQKLDGDAWMMVSAPGEVLLATLAGPIRGMRDVEGRWFAVAGATLFEVSPTGTATARGTLASAAGFVGMAHNDTQLALVDGPTLYVFNLADNTFAVVSSAGWRGSADVHELDGYMIFVAPGTQQFYLCAIDDATKLDALDFSSADVLPDAIVAHRVHNRQVWLFGAYSTEIWFNSGAASFPFARYSAYMLNVGAVGPRAAIEAAGTLWWVGQSRTGSGLVFMAENNRERRVSTVAVEQALAASSDLSKASMWTYQVEGHEFVGINAPGLSTTWVYDAATQQWHERGEWSADAGSWQPLRSRLHMATTGGIVAGDELGNLVRLDAQRNTLSGRPLVRERTWPHFVSPDAEAVCYRSLEVQARTGAPSDSGGSVAAGGATMTLQVSNDGGYTFGPPLGRKLGALGRWMQRVRWLGLGTARNRVFRLRCSDDVPFALYGATMEAG